MRAVSIAPPVSEVELFPTFGNRILAEEGEIPARWHDSCYSVAERLQSEGVEKAYESETNTFYPEEGAKNK